MMSSSSPNPLLPPNSPPAILPSTLPTPTHGPGGFFTVACSTHMAAPPSLCAETILRHAAYPSWDRFCRAITVRGPAPAPSASSPDAPDFARGGPEFLAPGTKMTFDVHMNFQNEHSWGLPTPLQVSVVERIQDDGGAAKGWRVAWKTRDSPGFVMRSERVQEFVETAGGETEYRCWETFYGMVAPVIRVAVGAQLVVAFGAWMDDLKEEAEAKVTGAA